MNTLKVLSEQEITKATNVLNEDINPDWDKSKSGYFK